MAAEWHTPRFESLAATLGKAWQCMVGQRWAALGQARLGQARLGVALLGRARKRLGDRQPPGFKAPAPAQGKARQGKPPPGMAGPGSVRRGSVWHGQAELGRAGNLRTRQERASMSPFEPAGEQSRWRVVYDILKAAAVDTVVTYEELGAALGLDPDKGRHAIQMAMRRAAQEHERQDKRAVDAVPNEGYRVVRAGVHLDLARKHGRKAGKSLQRGHSKAVNVDLSEVEDPEVRKALELTAQAFSLQMDFNRRFAVRQEQLEHAVREITDTQVTDRQRSADEVAKLRERIERLERERGE